MCAMGMEVRGQPWHQSLPSTLFGAGCLLFAAAYARLAGSGFWEFSLLHLPSSHRSDGMLVCLFVMGFELWSSCLRGEDFAH